MDVLVFGAGSLGSLLGGLLARTHDVTLVGRDPHVRAVREDGLRVDGVETFETRPSATTVGTGHAADLALVTVKAYDTETAAAALATGTFDAVCTLQNGMGNEETLASALDAPILAGTTTLGAKLAEPGRVEWRGRGTVTVGPWRAPATAVDRVASALATDLDVTVADDVRARLWEKLAVNVAINPATALAGVENGALDRAVDADAASVAETAARETARVARAEGVDLAPEDAVEAVREVVAATARNRSSMCRDVTVGRRTEIDAIGGYVLARARADDVAVPVTETLTTLVRAWERGEDLRSND
ncbi:MAG: ketopantoate reductase family protein [Haloplanus sp.]